MECVVVRGQWRDCEDSDERCRTPMCSCKEQNRGELSREEEGRSEQSVACRGGKTVKTIFKEGLSQQRPYQNRVRGSVGVCDSEEHEVVWRDCVL